MKMMKTMKRLNGMKVGRGSGALLAIVLAVFSTPVVRAAIAPLRVVATTEDLASLAREVGGDRVTVVALAKGYQDPHQVDAKPSFILEVSRADVLLAVGRELEIGWLPALITSGRNAKVQPGGAGLPRRVAERPDPRNCHRPDHAGDGRRPSTGQSALLARPGQRPPHRAGDPRQVRAAGARRARVFRAAVRRLRQASRRRGAEVGCGDGAVQGHGDRDLPSVVAELHGAIRPSGHRLRRAEARHSGAACPHHRSDQRDEAPQQQAHRRRAVLGA